MVKKIILVLAIALCVGKTNAQETYHENYRPQYHYSPKQGWMGDPDGMIYFKGKYHLMWWGHALSDDLVHWTEYTAHAMHGGPGGFGYWSGSVVADTENTAGFNTATDTALVAIYTMHYDNGYEKVGLSSSTNHVGFNYYEGNPVIATDQYDFRDPTVFWHNESNAWIMAITRSVEHSVEFYKSTDLKNWTYLSQFSSHGAKEQVWEVPDLFQLPVNGDEQNKKWVLACGMGPNKMQYWVGDFDGTNFTIDANDNLITGANVPGQVFADFETTGFGDWEVSGTAFGNAPDQGTLPDQQSVSGWVGTGFINSFHNGDATTGKMKSPEFTIEKRFINFLIGGGMGNDRQIRLIIDGQTVAAKTSLQNQEILRWSCMDVSEWIGQTAHLELVDEATGGWGHILVDQIVFSDVSYATGIENANWFDWGKDFYAARSYRNYSDNEEKRTIWIGWMGNWQYAQDVPTAPWKGNQSLPRYLELVHDTKGYRILQKPLDGFRDLRGEHYEMPATEIENTVAVDGFQTTWNVYELKASFKIDSDTQHFGLNLAENGSGKKLKIGFDAHTSTLYIDRRSAGNTSFNYSFKSKHGVPVSVPQDSVLDLHIFMDQTSVEVFANGYQTVLSSLVFTEPFEAGISLFSNDEPAQLLSLEAWKMNSIWEVEEPVAMISAASAQTHQTEIQLFPNPLKEGSTLSFETTGPFHVKNGQIRILTMAGKTVYTKKIVNQELSRLKLNGLAEQLTAGYYILRIDTGNNSITKQIIVD